MQGCNDFTPPFWEEVVLVLRLSGLSPAVTLAILGLFTPRRRAIFCRACKVELELTYEGNRAFKACPSCKQRVAFCQNKRTLTPEEAKEATLAFRSVDHICTQLAGHDGPCFERTRP